MAHIPAHNLLPQVLAKADCAAGECGARIYFGDELDLQWTKGFEEISGALDTSVPAEQRPQPLWVLYREMRQKGLAVD